MFCAPSFPIQGRRVCKSSIIFYHGASPLDLIGLVGFVCSLSGLIYSFMIFIFCSINYIPQVYFNSQNYSFSITTISGTDKNLTGRMLVPNPFVMNIVFFPSLIKPSANLGPYTEGTIKAPINGIFTCPP